MAVEVALEVAERDQVREGPLGGRLELAAVLAELRLDVLESEQRVHLGLGLAPVGLARGVVEHAVLGDVQALADGRVAERHVVLLGTGEVLEQVAELVRRDDLQVDAQGRVGPHPHPRLSRRAGRLDQVEVRRRRAQARAGRWRWR